MKWILSMALLCALPAESAVYTLPLPREVQQETLLCWAAVSAMATRAFPVTRTYRPSTQLEVVYFEMAGVEDGPIPGATSLPSAVEAVRTECEKPEIDCNLNKGAWLPGLASEKLALLPPAGMKMLSAGHFLQDIKVNKTPIIIRWFYKGLAPRQPGDPVLPPRHGSHVLLVTGYDDVKQEIRVWDPWPHRKPGQSAASERLPPGHKREKWIALQRYFNPVKDNGWRVAPVHDYDQFALRLRGRPFVPSAYPALVAQSTIQPVIGDAPAACDERAKARYVEFRSGPPAVRQVADDHIRKLVVRDENDEPRQARLDPAGAAIPIVAFGSDDLWRARANPQTLLKSQTSALVVPVMEHGYLVDSFLLLYEGGQWKEGGYSNNEIARLLVEVRDRPAFRNRKSELYLVSIPEEGTFFAAHGFEGDARLLSLANDARGEFVPARDLLEPVVRQVERSRRSEKTSKYNVADDLETR